jgi:glycosyltransferase involved in cell wall biosynthesis
VTGARKPVRIVFVHSSNEMYGADRILLQVIDSLPADDTLRVEVWLPADVRPGAESVEHELRKRGIAVSIVPLPILRRAALRPRALLGLGVRAMRLWCRLLTHRVAIVYCTTSAALLAAPIARSAGVRTVVLHNQEIWAGGDRRALATLAGFCTNGIAISDASRASVCGPLARRIQTIENSVPDSNEPLIPLPAEGPLQFVIASRWNAWKGHGTLLSAWDSLSSPPGHLTILGAAPDAGITADVEAMVADLQNPDSVSVVGQTADIRSFIDGADFMIVPSDEPEPFGLVAIEAFSRGRAVIGTRGGGLAEIVTDGTDGILFEHRESVSLARILSSVDRQTASRLGVAARNSYVEKYSQERYFREFSVFWKSLIDGSKLRPLEGKSARMRANHPHADKTRRHILDNNIQ